MRHLVKVLCIISFLHTSLWAHAHMFIDFKLHAVVNESGLTGIYVNWTFDKMFAAFIKKEFDVNKDNKLSKEEQLQVYEKSFKEWKVGDYFGILKLNDETIAFPTAQKFSSRLTQQGNSAEYTFFVPLSIPASETVNRLELYFIDAEMYIAFDSESESLSVVNKAESTVAVSHSLKTIEFKDIGVFEIIKKSGE